MSQQTFHLTTAIPYVNGLPHIGHVLEWFQADVIARHQRLLGKDVSFTSGADENSLKNVQAAEKAGKEVQAFLDEYSTIFRKAYDEFGISLTEFRRGSDQEKHWPGVQKLWEMCDISGDIYKKTYTGLYCVGCESFYKENELVEGKCPNHPNQVPEKVSEENYFFKLSNYQDQIKQLITSGELTIVSEQFKNEMLAFIDRGLEDFSISRSRQRARGVGVPVPTDDSQIMYVWFDALTIYMTSIGWGYDQALWEKYWPANVHFIGKDINRFHSIYWIGMLLSAHLPLPKTISVHGFITSEGQKMSKSLGNVVDPYEVVKQYGLEPVRYYLLRYIPAHNDGDFSHQAFQEVYTAELANGIGNLCSRVAKMCDKAGFENLVDLDQAQTKALTTIQALENYDTQTALLALVDLVAKEDKYLAEQQPWKKTGDEQATILAHSVETILVLAHGLKPFLPETATTIWDHFNQKQIKTLTPLFPRLSDDL